ncbi:MAG: UDP-N-acetylglucosamine 2-epimerase (non-hydrolyzing) [Armatimonadota bacterium]|nr:MAG: UDP-N-acetylglucosamine 2-epimerase (non-hydrolyzing) [Armatimonadota bacterium]
MRPPLRTMVVMGTRPEVMKLGPVAVELKKYPKQFGVTLVGTGQHREMVPQHLGLFGLRLNHDLGVMKRRQTLADITSRTMRGMYALLGEKRPDVLVVEGDTTAVLVAGLAAFYRQVPVAHVEAGLRTRDRYDPFPEEMNRRLVGGLAEVHFAPTAGARENLLRENVSAESIFVTGNTSVDAVLLAAKRRPRQGAVPAGWLKGKRLVLVTAHRRESWERGIEEICLALRDLAEAFAEVVIVYAVHPNPVVRETAERVLGGQERVHLIEPPGYVEFVDLMKRCYLILTDSGGIQEEAPSLNKPVLVMRRTTERPEGVEAGCAELVGTDRRGIVGRAAELLKDKDAYQAMASSGNPFGDGKAAVRIRRALAYHFGLSGRRPRDFAGM